MDNISTVLSALNVFTRAPDKAALETANSWLQDFQHSSEAWATCNVLLLTPEAPQSAKMFAAQTFRSKVTYDLSQVDAANIPALRDTLLAALQQHQSGPRTLITQLCLALVGLALQYPQWLNPVQQMAETFGGDATAVPVLLQFLTLLPEEMSSATRYPLTDDDLSQRSAELLTANSDQVLGLLAMYLQASGVTADVQEQVFTCLRSWLAAGEISPTKFAETPLFAFAFEALGSDRLFDAATNVICDLIHETQEIDSNMAVIQLIVPRVIALRPQLATYANDAERIKGYARIFSEAGYTYKALVVEHTVAFFPIVEAIGECSAYHDLDIVPITFPFWMQLAIHFEHHAPAPPVFINAYRALLEVIIRHLHFPPDSEPLTGQEAEDFRSFRHIMGDTLKDCCIVLGSDTCLLAAHAMIMAQGPNATWQDIEAPLFGLRSMGAEVKPMDEGAVPKIMDLIPSLPTHPKVHYAALLIISRYTEWISFHPQYISFQLQYISAGFETGDMDVSSAAGMALKYLCQDCKQHLTDFLPTLHSFLQSSGAKLHQDDKVQVYEAIAHVISAMPMANAATALRKFSDDILSEMLAVTNKTAVTKAEMASVCNSIENLEALLFVVRSFGEELPPACQGTVAQTWAVFDGFLAKYGGSPEVAERVTRVLRWGVPFYGTEGVRIAPAMLRRLAQLFDDHVLSGYIWIAGKVLAEYAGLRGEFVDGFPEAVLEVYQRVTRRVAEMMATQGPNDIPDALEDYVHMVSIIMYNSPDIFFHPPTFELCFKICVPMLELVYASIVAVTLDLFRDIMHIDDDKPTHVAVISRTFLSAGLPLINAVLEGVIGDFYEEKTGCVVSIMRSAVKQWPAEVMRALPEMLSGISEKKAGREAKAAFLADMRGVVASGQLDKVRYSILTLRRSTRKARERRRDGLV